MDPITALLNDGDPSVAVVGATDNPNKYGSVIYRDLKAKGYRVYPVNPNRDTVDGDLAYDRAAELGIENIWVQPGAEDNAVMERLRTGGFNYLANACIMVRARAKAAS